jgi:AcrR family transcriptional regulator
MENRKAQEQLIVDATANLLREQGPPPLSNKSIADRSGLSRQLVKYYFDEPDELVCKVCDHLADAYRIALANGVEGLDGLSRLQFVFDFYFDLVEETPKPRDDQSYDAAFAYAAGSEDVRTNLRNQYKLLGQVLQIEIKTQFPDLSLEDCAEASYLFVIIMYGHWKMVASLGLNEDHKHVARRSIDRIIDSFANNAVERLANVRVWET